MGVDTERSVHDCPNPLRRNGSQRRVPIHELSFCCHNRSQTTFICVHSEMLTKTVTE